MSETTDVSRLSGTAISPIAHEETHSQYVDNPLNVSWYEHPHSIFVQPVFDNLNDQYSELVGVILANVAWDRYLANLLPEGVNGIYAVLENTCGQSFTYVIRGKKAVDFRGLAFRWQGDQYAELVDFLGYAFALLDFVDFETKPAPFGLLSFQ